MSTDPYPDNKPSPSPTSQQPSPCQPVNSCSPTSGGTSTGQDTGCKFKDDSDSILNQIYSNTETIKSTTTSHFTAFSVEAATNQINHVTTHTGLNTLGNNMTAGFNAVDSTINNVSTVLNNVKNAVDFVSTKVSNALGNQTIQGAIGAINIALNIHNAMMLSKNLTYTFGEVINSVSQALGLKLKDGEGNDQ